jgi:hypothetical protein
MTIREYCANRARSVRKVAIIIGVLVLLACSAYSTIARLQLNSWYIAGVTGLFIFIVMHIGMNRIKCPRCGASLRHTAYRELSPTAPPLAVCPGCRVSLDEPTERST